MASYRSCWVLPSGEVLYVSFGEHWLVAEEYFEDRGQFFECSDDHALTVLGWLKISVLSSGVIGVVYISRDLTYGQKRAVREMDPDVIIDDFESNAKLQYREVYQ